MIFEICICNEITGLLKLINYCITDDNEVKPS